MENEEGEVLVMTRVGMTGVFMKSLAVLNDFMDRVNKLREIAR